MDTILVIDDNEDILDFLSDILKENYQVYLAIDGDQALKILKEKPINLVVSDIMMPGLDGFELCQLIKSTIEYGHIPIILLTSKNTYAAEIDGLKVGADAYIRKPFSPEYLMLQIANLIANRQKVQSHFSGFSVDGLAMLSPSKADAVFLEKLNEYIHQNIHNFRIDINELANHMNMSRPTFYRKIKTLLSFSPKELIDQARIRRATELIASNQYSLQQISNMVGYRSPSVFGKLFRKYHQLTPSDYLQSLKKEPQRQP